MIKIKKLKRVLFLITENHHKDISSIVYQLKKNKIKSNKYNNSVFVRESLDFWIKKQAKILEKKNPSI